MSNDYTVERRIKQQKLKRKARRGEIALRRLYKLVRFLIILSMFYIVYRLGNTHYWYISSDIYKNPKGASLEILGNNIVPSEKIINAMKKIPNENKPVYKINPAKMAEQIEKLTPVKRAYVRRFWLPARYVVMLEEVTPAITIAPSENAPEIAAMAHSGEFIEREYLPFKYKTDSVKILSYGTKGDDYKKWDKEKIEYLYKLYKLLQEYSGEKVEYIDLRTPHDAYAQLESAKVRLGETDIDLYERIKPISAILNEVKKINFEIKYIDLSWKDSKYLKIEKKL